jgi:hypothetical protein
LRAEGSGKKRNSIGLGDELALCIADAACEIQNLVDDRAHAGLGHHDRHFVDDGEELALDDFVGDRID